MANGLHKYTVQEAQNAALGQAGSVFIDDTDIHTGPFVAIAAIEDSAVSLRAVCQAPFLRFPGS